MSHFQPSPPLVRTLGRLQNLFWRRRLLHGLVRAAWVSLLVPTGVLFGYLWWGWQVPWYLWLSSTLLIALLLLFWSMRPVKLKTMTRRLDNLLDARAQLVTALEVGQSAAPPASPNPVVEQLMAGAVNLSAEIRQQVRLFNRGFWLEVQALVAVVALLAALVILDALSPTVPNATPIDLPSLGQEPRADEVLPPDARLLPPPFQQPQPLTQAQVQAALEALAEALRDQAVTRAAAEAIDQGDLGGAAEALRRLADQLEGLSDEAQRELGQSMQEAGDNMGGDVPGFSQPLQQGSQSLESGDTAGGSQALEELAETLDSLAESQQEVPGQTEAGETDSGEAESDSEQAGEEESEAQSSETNDGGGGEGDGEGGEGDQDLGEAEERLPIDGEPLELESDSELDDRVLQPSELDAQTGDERTSDSPFARQPLNAPSDELGADPLSYPWEKRDIVRDYFTPSQELGIGD